MANRTHRYAVDVVWTGNNGSGTRDYRSYARDHEIHVPGKPVHLAAGRRVFPENVGSLVLHRRAGFREVGRRERLGELNGVWRDVVLLERRSRRVGVS